MIRNRELHQSHLCGINNFLTSGAHTPPTWAAFWHSFGCGDCATESKSQRFDQAVGG
jgi:hypothetical protein